MSKILLMSQEVDRCFNCICNQNEICKYNDRNSVILIVMGNKFPSDCPLPDIDGDLHIQKVDISKE